MRLVPRSRGCQVEVGPGDVLYIPPFWFHYVQAMDACVSVR